MAEGWRKTPKARNIWTMNLLFIQDDLGVLLLFFPWISLYFRDLHDFNHFPLDTDAFLRIFLFDNFSIFLFGIMVVSPLLCQGYGDLCWEKVGFHFCPFSPYFYSEDVAFPLPQDMEVIEWFLKVWEWY